MFAGLLNELIDIYSPTFSRNEYGEQLEVMALSYSTRAKVSHVGGSRQVIDNEIQIPYQKTFVVRIYVPVNETDQILYEGKYYRVMSIEIDKSKQQKIVITELIDL